MFIGSLPSRIPFDTLFGCIPPFRLMESHFKPLGTGAPVRLVQQMLQFRIRPGRATFGSALPVQDEIPRLRCQVFDWFGQRIFNTVHRNNLALQHMLGSDPRLRKTVSYHGVVRSSSLITLRYRQ